MLILFCSSPIHSVESFNLLSSVDSEGSNDYSNGHGLLSQAARVRSRRVAISDDGTLAIKDAETLVPKNYSIHEPPMTTDGEYNTNN